MTPQSPLMGSRHRVPTQLTTYIANFRNGTYTRKDLGVVHLSYRSNEHKLKDGVVQFNIQDKPTSIKRVVHFNLDQAPSQDLCRMKDSWNTL